VLLILEIQQFIRVPSNVCRCDFLGVKEGDELIQFGLIGAATDATNLDGVRVDEITRSEATTRHKVRLLIPYHDQDDHNGKEDKEKSVGDKE